MRRDEIIAKETWQRWQAAYAVKRRETFISILEARGKRLATLFICLSGMIQTGLQIHIRQIIGENQSPVRSPKEKS
jgi:hypothetical protein